MANEQPTNNNKLNLKTIYEVINKESGKSDQNLFILASDPQFLIILLQDVLSVAIEKVGKRNGIFTTDNQEKLTDAVETNDVAQISDALSYIFSRKYKEKDNLYWNSIPSENNNPGKVRTVHPFVKDKFVYIPASKMINLTPQTRSILGFDGITFSNPQTGLIEIPSKGIFQMSKSELDAWSEKSNISSYTGIDITTSVAIGNILTNINDIKTVSYSTHRSNVQVRAIGSALPRGISRGPITIAGSIICTVRLMDPMKRLDPQTLMGYDSMVIESDADLFKAAMLPVQYPLFDLMVMYQNELGDASVLLIYGISLHDTGQTSSISDTETEIQYVYSALDIEPIKMVRFRKDGTIISPFQSDEYMKRKQRIINGLSLHSNPYDIPSVKTTFGNLSHLDFIL